MLFSALRASHFLLLRQKKVSKEKATPRLVPAASVPCATRNAGWLAKLACGSNNASQKPPAFLRCSAPFKGPGKPSMTNRQFSFLAFSGVHRSIRFFRYSPAPRRLSGRHVARRATEKSADKGRGLSEGRRPEFRSPRRFRVAQGSRRSRPCKLGSPFLWLLSFGEAKESTPALKAENNPPEPNPISGHILIPPIGVMRRAGTFG
jgi:hypothetical protein